MHNIYESVDNKAWALNFAQEYISNYSSVYWETNVHLGQAIFLCKLKALGPLFCSRQVGCTNETVVFGNNFVYSN